jgi:DNA-binding MarR family transcriptional regulator
MDATPTTTSDPRWLDHAEKQTWLGLVGLFVRLPAALESDLQRTAGLSFIEYVVLAGLSEAPGRTLRMSELAGHANSSLSRLSHVVARLEKRGWVRRAPWDEDGRHTIATLQQDGYDKLVGSAPAHIEAVRRLVVDALTPAQLRQLDRITAAVSRRVNAEFPCPAPDRHPRPGSSPGR